MLTHLDLWPTVTVSQNRKHSNARHDLILTIPAVSMATDLQELLVL